MGILFWSTKRVLQVSGYVESFIEGRVYTPQAVRGLQDTPDVVGFNPPIADHELRIEEGLTERVAGNRFLYRKVGVPKGLVFNYQLTHV